VLSCALNILVNRFAGRGVDDDDDDDESPMKPIGTVCERIRELVAMRASEEGSDENLLGEVSLLLVTDCVASRCCGCSSSQGRWRLGVRTSSRKP